MLLQSLRALHLGGFNPKLRTAVRKAVMQMSEAGKLSPTSINDYARCLNAFLKWLSEEGHVTEFIKIPKIKTLEKVPALLSARQVAAVIQYRPGAYNGARDFRYRRLG